MFNKEIQPSKSRLDQELEEVIISQVGPQFAAIEERLTQIEKRLSREDSTSERPPNYLDYAAEPVVLYLAEPEPEYEAEPEERVQIPYVEDIAAGPPIPQSED
ncbi:MAG: hypothetical protein LBJ24_00790, partial [Treponema sp.]|nr:hypothetical protein [Treponema sp.]